MTYKHKQIQEMLSITMTSFALKYFFSMFTTFQVDFNNDSFMHLVILNLQSHFNIFQVCVWP
jgi:hypothetical protein